MVFGTVSIVRTTVESDMRDIIPICPICGEEHPEEEMIGEVCASCASIMQDIDFES